MLLKKENVDFMRSIDNFTSSQFFIDDKRGTTLVYLVTKDTSDAFLQKISLKQKKYLEDIDFDPQKEQYWILPHDDGNGFAIVISYTCDNHNSIITMIDALPKYIKSVELQPQDSDFDMQKMAYLWTAHYYQCDYYKKLPETPKLYLPELSQKTHDELRALFLGRNAINLPAEDLTPFAIQEILENFATEFQAECKTFIGSELLDKGFNLIHAVGRGIIDDQRQPRLIDFNYKTDKSENPKNITLIGKGVCFDNGGLNIKTGNSMKLMKKDMGGAGTILAIALNLLLQKPDFNLRVLIPAVENNIAANSFRPGDIFKAYNGKTVEITNTDAEGRLILADALSYATEQNPDLLIDIATLTGAARVAVGPDLPILYTNNTDFIDDFMKSECYQDDPVWPLPLWQPYASAMHGSISDLVNSEAGGMAGSIKAALFLQNFIGQTKNWVHFDSYCYVPEAKAGHPKGCDIMPYQNLCHFIHKFVG